MAQRPRLATTLGIFAIGVFVAGAANTAPAQAATAGGSLRVAVSGMAKGQPVSVVLSRSGQKTRTVRRQGQLLRGLRAGVWRVRVLPVKTARRAGAVPRVATVFPRRTGLSVRVRPKRTAQLRVAYGSVLNPRVRPAPAALSVAGNPVRPTSITVPVRGAPGRGSIILSGPAAMLPEGLVARVTRVAAGPLGTRTLLLTHIPVSEAVPVISYSGPLLDQRKRSAGFGAYADLKLEGSACGVFGGFDVGGSFRFGTPRIEAQIDAGRFGFKAKAVFVIHSQPEATVRMTTDGGVFCERELAAPTFIVGYIPAGPVPVPVYASIPLTMRAEASARTIMTSKIAWDMAVGVRSRGVMLAPVFEAHNPSMDIQVSSDVTSKVGPSVGLEAGVGLRGAASISVTVATAVEFSTSGRQCSWDWKLGEFTGEAAVGPLTLRTPSGSVSSHRLWTGCGSSTFTPPDGGGDGGRIPGMPRFSVGPADPPIRPAEFRAGPSNCSPCLVITSLDVSDAVCRSRWSPYH